MAFPDPSLPAPALGVYELSYNGLRFGGLAKANPYQLQQLPGGLDGAPVASGDVQRALEQGELIGLDVYQGRDISIDLVVKADGTSLDHARRQLAGALAVAGATERPLYMQLPSGCFACMARPRKYSFALDIGMVLAGGGVAHAMLHATDPRWYAAPSKRATVGMPAPPGGVTFPLTFPVSFGGGGVGGILEVWNFGTFECRPELLITGPATNPTISNLSLPGAPSLTVHITLAAGDTLAIDTDFQTVVYTTAGSSAGSPRRDLLDAASTWWNLPPGLSLIEFTTTDVSQAAGTLTVLSADAFAGL